MEILFQFLTLFGLLLAVCGITCILNYYMRKRGFSVNALANQLIVVLVTVALYVFGGLSIWTVKGVIMLLVLLYASVQDISTHEADDSLWVMLLILALVGFGDVGIVSMLMGGLLVFIPQMAIAMFTNGNGIGGADIKISTAAAVLLGLFGGVLGYVIGLTFAVIFNLIYNKVKKQASNKAFALLPFISAGLMVGYFI